MIHDLDQITQYVRSALEQGNKPIGFLLGAGAPMSVQVEGKPLIPGLEQLTDDVVESAPHAISDTLRTLIGHLDKKDRRNLEVILSYLRALISLPGDATVRGFGRDELMMVEHEITNTIRHRVDAELPATETPYQALALWVSAVARAEPVQMFTTNYDLLVEQAFERNRVAYFDGFMGSREPLFDLQAVEEDALPARWVQLWKVHGSINWFQDETGNVKRLATSAQTNLSALVYPSHLKYEQSRRLPYLALMDRLRAFLRKPGAVLVTTGYSFRDQHINEIVEQSLRGNSTASVQGLLFGALVDYVEARELATRLPNLTLVSKDSGIVGTRTGTWADKVALDGTVTHSASNLGDFVEFGHLLTEISGSRPQVAEERS